MSPGPRGGGGISFPVITGSCLCLVARELCCVPRYTSCRAFLSTLHETGDYAGQHEVISENMTAQILVDLARYVQELKQERKAVSHWFLVLRHKQVMSWARPAWCES